MVSKALYVRLEAKPGKEAEVAALGSIPPNELTSGQTARQ